MFAPPWEVRLTLRFSAMRGGYQELATKEFMTFEKLGEKLAQLDAAKGRAERELAGLQSRRGSIEKL
jgi:hypothetical protein